MEEHQLQTRKFIITYGLLLAGVNIVFTLILFSMDMHYQGGLAVLGVILVLNLAAILLALSQYKKQNSGYMTFKQGLKIGLGLTLIAGTIGVLFNQLLIHVIDPEAMQKSFDYARAQMEQNPALTPEQIDGQLEMQKKFSTPFMMIAFGLLFSLFFGFILTLIPALVMKKQPPQH